MPEAKKWPPGLRDRQSLSSDQSEDGSPLNTRGADSTRPPTDDSYAAVTWVAQGTHSARCSGNLQPAQNNGAREGMNPGSCRDLPGSEGNRSLGPRVADQGSLHFPGTSSSGKLKVRLCNHALWLPFSRQQNEMILTKQGRAMFPFLVYEIQGMDPSALYRVFVEVGSFDNYRWRYQCKKWLPCSQEEEDNVPGNRFYQHPDSPNTGAHWMHREVSFQKLKLTNKNTACNNGRQGPILLKSLHKYQPRLHIEEVSNGKQPTLTSSSRHTFTFPDTAFIAVTAYHNAEITRLKIQNNPFATAHRGGTSRPGQNLQNPPQAGEGTDFTSSPPSLVQEGPGQEKGCDLMHGSQPPSGHQYDSGDNRSTTSLSVPSNMEGLNPEPLPCTFPNAKSYHVSTDTPITQGNWPPSPSNCTCNENITGSLQSESPKPLQAGTGTEEEERVQEQCCQSISRHPSDVSHLGQRTSKKRCLSPVDSAQDSLASGSKTREQEDMCLVACKCGGNSSQEASCYPVVLQEYLGQAKEKMNPTPGNSIQEIQPPSELPSDSTDLDLNSVLRQLFPSISPTAILYEASPDTPIRKGNWPNSPSNCTSNVNSLECLQSESPKPQQAGTGTEEEERVQEHLCQSISRHPSDVSHLGQRTPKKRCLSPADSAKDSLASGLKTREQEDMCPVASECDGNSSQETVSEPSGYPVVLQEDPDQNKEQMNWTPGNSFQESQPPSEHFSDLTDLDPNCVLCEFFPSIAPSAMLYEASPGTPITQGIGPHSPANCTSTVNSMECLQFANPEPQQAGTGAEEEERLQEQLCPSNSWSPSNVSQMGQRTSKKRYLSPVDPAKNFSGPAWKAREQEVKCPVARESSGNSSQEAVPEPSCYPVVLQEDPGQNKEKMSSTPCDLIEVTQPHSDIAFHSNHRDLLTVSHQLFPSTSPPAMPYELSPENTITERNWPPSLSNCTPSVNTPYSDKDPLASRWTIREQVDKCLRTSEPNDFSTEEAISEDSCYPAVVQDDIGRAQEEIIPNPCYSIHETQPPLEFSCQANALDLGALIHQVFTSPSLPTMPYDPSADIPINQGNWTPFPSNCTLNVNRMECFPSVNPKPQQVGTVTEEEERLQYLLGPSSSRSPSDVSHLRQRTSKKRCFSPADSSKDFSASAWKALEQEVKCPVDKESSGISSQEAVSEASCYPVLLQEDPGQSKVKTNPTPCDLIQETQSHSHLAFHSNHRDLLTVSHQLFPSTCPPAIPYEPSPDNTITERNWPPSHSNCTSSVNIPYSDKDSLASRWTTREQVDKCLRASESNDFSTQETISEGSCYPAGWQDYIGQAQEEIIPNPSDPIQVTQPPSELPFHFNALDLDALIHQVFSSTSPPTVPYEPSADFPITQGNWPHSLSNCTSNVNSMECFLSVNPKPQQGGTVTEDEESLQDQLGPSSFRSPSNVSQMGQRTSEKRFLSQVDSAKDFSGPAWKAREQEVKHPVASKSSGHSSQEAASEASCYPVILQEDPGQTKEKMNPTPWDSIPCTRPPSQLPFHCNGLAQVPVIDRFFPFIFPPTMPYEPSPATHITQGNWPCSLSNCTSNVNSMECFQPDSPKPQQGGTVTTEEERLQDQVCPSSSRSPSDVSHLGQRTSKKRCLSPVNSVMDSLASACTTREQEEKCLVACENSGNSSQKAVSEASSYPVVLQEDIGRAKEKKNPTPLDSILETQPTSGLSFDPNLYAGIHQYFPSSSPPASPHEPSPNTPITQGNWPYSFSNCTSKVTSMECFWPGSQKPQQGSTGTGEEERLQEPLCPSSFRSPSDVSHLGQRPSKRRCLSPVDSAKDFSASAWEAREEEVKCPVASESSGNSSQEAVSEASCYPVVLREENGQAKEKNATPWDYILETQPPSELTFGSALSDVTHQFFPSTSPAMPYPTSPEQPITQGSCPPSLSTGTSNGNHVDSFHSGNQILREQALGPRKKKDFRSNSTHPAPGPLQMSPTCGKEVPRRDAYLQ